MRPHRIVFVIFPRFQSLDLAGPFEVFAAANTGLRRPAYELVVAARDAGPVRSESGLEITATASLAEVARRRIGTLVVVGGDGVLDARDDPAFLDAFRTAAGHADRVASVCSGTFVLAAAGLIDGVRVTTHWRRAARLAAEHPAVEVDPEPIHVRSGRIWTSAGVTAGIDLALAMVEEDHDGELAQGIARMLVMFLRRPGGQTQFSSSVWARPPATDPIRAVLDHVQADPGGVLTVPALAAIAMMSQRHFLRVFSREVGCTPAVYVERVRVEAARQLLETTGDGVEQIASACGFGTAETLRRAFLRRLGVPPSDYRERFTQRRPAPSPH